MKEEKMMILAMLEEGKITAEEAIKLIEALEENEEYFEEDKTDKKSDYKMEDKFNFKDTLNNLEDFGSDVSTVLSNMFDGLKDFSSSVGQYNYNTTTSNLEMDLSEIESPILDLKAINGDINVRQSDKDNMTIKVICQYKKGLLVANEPYFDFTNVDGKIIFAPKYNSNISIKLDVTIPEKFYKEIKLNTSNGKIYIHSLNAKALNCSTSNSSIIILRGDIESIDLTTKNGKIEIMDVSSNIIKAYTTNSNINLTNVKSETIDAKTGNSKIILDDIKAMDLICKTSNSPIDARAIDSPNIYFSTSNGRIELSEINTKTAKDIHLLTSNNSISSEIDGLEKEMIFDLETSMGNIELDIPNLVYTTNKQVNLGLKKIIANSIDYDANEDHLKLVASTSNGSIKIS